MAYLKIFLFVSVFIFTCTLEVKADYTSPGAGKYFTMDSLVFYSSGAVTTNDTSFFINSSIIISNSDTLTISPGNRLVFTDLSGNDYLEINGALFAYGSIEDSIVITSQNKSFGDYYGIYFRNISTGSDFMMRYCRIEYAERAIDFVSADGIIKNSLIQHTSVAAVDLFSSNVIIQNCVIHHNRQYAIKMTQNSSPTIDGNLFTENNFENTSPYAIISIGIQGTNSPTIKNNTIIGTYEMSGAIGIWLSSNALIENNYIENCGYGILCYQSGANPIIKDNTLIANTIHPDTLNWGFGIACNGSNAPIITGNELQDNYYGVAIINGAQPNCGNLNNADTTDDGENHFLGNGIGHNLYELYNNNSLPIYAENNWWGTDNPDSIEARIVHQSDNPAFGFVDYIPFITNIPTFIESFEQLTPEILTVLPAYPNPFNPVTNFEFIIKENSYVSLKIYNITGKLIKTYQNKYFSAGVHKLQWNGRNDFGNLVSTGFYYLKINTHTESETIKLIMIQ